MKKIIFTAFILVQALTVLAQKERTIVFYNVENLFDTINQANDDEEFLPEGKNHWTKARYDEKIAHIDRILDTMNKPLFVGMVEIENAGVVRDVLNHSKNLRKYGLVHFESPDKRGIDVALVYDSMTVKLLSAGKLRFTLPNETEPTTRDIVWGKFLYGKDTLIGMVNHWPSRRGGQAESEPNRMIAAQTARHFIDSVLAVNPNSKIFFMGDLNDYPTDNAPKLVAEKLTPMIGKQSGEFGGSYSYKSEWDVLDHIMVSPGFFSGNKKSLKVVPESGKIYSFPYLIEVYKGEKVPFRTYAGSKYLGGYSDHLPVSITLKGRY